MGKFHPLFVHFPVVLVTAAFVLDLICFFLKKRETKHLYEASSWFLIVAALFLIPTVITGIGASWAYPPGDLRVNLHWEMAYLTTGVVAGSALARMTYLLNRPVVSKRGTLLLTILSFFLITVTGDLGTAITHGTNFISMFGSGSQERKNNFYTQNSPQARRFTPEQLGTYLTKQITVEDVIPIFVHNNCIKCHNSRFEGDKPLYFSTKEGDMPIWLPRDKDNHLVDWKNSEFYRIVIAANRMPYDKDNHPIGLTWSERLILLHWLQNDAPTQPPVVESDEESQDIPS